MERMDSKFNLAYKLSEKIDELDNEVLSLKKKNNELNATIHRLKDALEVAIPYVRNGYKLYPAKDYDLLQEDLDVVKAAIEHAACVI